MITEVGEQLAWIGAALRTSSAKRGVSLCTPLISRIESESVGECVYGPRPRTGDRRKFAFSMSFHMKNVEKAHQVIENGRCWHNLLRSPVIVKGFPIPRRNQKCAGLEIPLGVMAELAQARRVTSFDGKIYVKGFSTVLVPTQKTGDLLSWHLRYNADGSHLSYLDDRIPAIQQDYPQGCEIFDLKNFRHILGWASAVKCHVGRCYC